MTSISSLTPTICALMKIDAPYNSTVEPLRIVLDNAKNILGKKAYASVLDIKESIDLAVIAVPAKIVPQVINACGQKKIPYAVIISSGFSEVGEKELEAKVKEIAASYKIKVLGPNCLGLINPYKKLNSSFFRLFCEVRFMKPFACAIV